MQESASNSDPRYHVANVGHMLNDLVRHLREDIRKFDEPKAQALFETSAEVLQGLHTAFTHYETGSEPVIARCHRERIPIAGSILPISARAQTPRSLNLCA